ncbi:copper resistance D family protein [Oceanobacillus sp. CFH 90083]|uniref:copper resistance D family protein n=1 Tax=Oceanobacillus sp. CFH 90083 TaxID=2592336 RepID=UPI00128BB12D|nr:CopD family protein [Oceanobacillus sp. CFH 90083]
MFYVTIFTEMFLYLCLAFLAGSFLIRLLPATSPIKVHVSSNLQLAAIWGIALFAFIPLIQLIRHITARSSLGSAFEDVLLSFRIGNAWLFLFTICILFSVYIAFVKDTSSKQTAWVGMIFTGFVAFGIGWASHAGSFTGFSGVFTHAVHMLTVSAWIGTLMMACWFVPKSMNWLTFIKSYHPFALTCFVIVVLSGILLAQFTVDLRQYDEALLVSYGQSLFLKQLFIIPLVIYAIFNGIWMKRRLQADISLQARPWVRVEFFIILFILLLTGIMNEQSPPLHIESLIAHSGYAPILDMFYEGSVDGVGISLALDGSVLFFIALALACLAGSIYIFKTKRHPALSYLASLLFVVMGYFAFIQSIVIS